MLNPFRYVMVNKLSNEKVYKKGVELNRYLTYISIKYSMCICKTVEIC